MKTRFFVFVGLCFFPVLTFAAEPSCPTPTGDVAGAFETIAHPEHGSLAYYFESHAIPNDAVNERCETLLKMAVRYRNVLEIQYLLSLSPNIDLMARDPKQNLSTFEYALQYGDFGTIESFRKLAKIHHVDFSEYNYVIKNSKDVIEKYLNAHPIEPQDQRCQAVNLVLDAGRPNAILEMFLKRAVESPPHMDPYYKDVCLKNLVNRVVPDGNIDQLKLLLKYGATLNPKADFDGSEMTPIHYAIRAHQVEMVKFLIQQGANLDVIQKLSEGETYFSSITVLDYALYFHDPEIVKEILDRKPIGHYSMTFAIRSQNLEVARMVFEARKKIDPKSSRYSFDDYAAMSIELGNLELLKLCVEYGQKLNQDHLRFAFYKRNFRLMDYILAQGVDINARASFTVGSLLTHTFQNLNPPDYEMMDYLLAHGADPMSTQADSGACNLVKVWKLSFELWNRLGCKGEFSN